MKNKTRNLPCRINESCVDSFSFCRFYATNKTFLFERLANEVLGNNKLDDCFSNYIRQNQAFSR